MPKDNVMFFDPVCRMEDAVYHVFDTMNENPLMVTNFNINAVNDKNEVIDYTIGCSNIEGRVAYFKPFEIKAKVNVNGNNS